jgi:putative endonuclease
MTEPVVEPVETTTPLNREVSTSSTSGLSVVPLMMRGMAYTYMLLCSDRTFYVGSTTDLERRMTEHRVGLGSEYTRHRLPVELVWYEQYDNVDHAFMREKQIQNWSRAKRLALIRGELGDLPRLANTLTTPHP